MTEYAIDLALVVIGFVSWTVSTMSAGGGSVLFMAAIAPLLRGHAIAPVTTFAAIVARCFEPRHLLPMPNWLPRIRRSLEVALYVLLLLQPLSGWLLAGHEGRLATLFGWPLPPLAPRAVASLTMAWCITGPAAHSSCSLRP
jgi:cytochrome b561